MGALVDINTDGLAKLDQIVGNWLGLEAIAIERNADANAFASVRKAEAENAAALIRLQGEEQVANYMLAREKRKMNNTISVVDLAQTQFTEGEQASDEPVNPDWLNRFFSIVEDVSDKDMQQLLVFPNIKMANKIENGNLLYITEEQVEEKLDVKPELVRYYRPFRGDSSDNISSAATRVQSKYLKPVAESIRTNLLQGNTLDMAYDKAVVQHIATLSANALSTIQSGKNIYIRNFCLMDLLKYNKNPLEISYVSLPALNQSGFLEILNKYQMNEFKKYYFETLSALGVGNALQD